MPAVSTALSRQPPFTELALGTKQALTVIKDQKIPNLVGDASLRQGAVSRRRLTWKWLNGRTMDREGLSVATTCSQLLLTL